MLRAVQIWFYEVVVEGALYLDLNGIAEWAMRRHRDLTKKDWGAK